MTALTSHSAYAHRPSVITQIIRGFRLIIEGIGEGMTLRSRYEELSRLSDADLAQRGIRREDIARVVMTNRYI